MLLGGCRWTRPFNGFAYTCGKFSIPSVESVHLYRLAQREDFRQWLYSSIFSNCPIEKIHATIFCATKIGEMILDHTTSISAKNRFRIFRIVVHQLIF